MTHTSHRLSAAAVIWLAAVAPLVAQAPSADQSAAIKLYEAGDRAAAGAAFRRMADANSSDAVAAFYLGRIAFDRADYDDAVAWFERATKIDTARSSYFSWLGRAYGRQAQGANVLRQLPLALKTRAAFEHAVALDPNNLEARSGLVEYYRKAPEFAGGSMQLAYAQAEEIRRRDAFEGGLELGKLYESENKYADAERWYRSAAQAQPKKLTAHYRLGYMFQKMEQFEKAYATFEEIVRRDSTTHAAYYYIGETAIQADAHHARAEQALKHYITTAPATLAATRAGASGIGWAHYRLGQLYERAGNRDAARTEYRTAVQLSPALKEAALALRRVS